MKPTVIEFGRYYSLDLDETIQTVTVTEGKFIRQYDINDQLPLRIKNAIKRYIKRCKGE